MRYRTCLAFQNGDAVKLTDRYAEALCKAPKNRIDWKARRGVVSWCGRNSVAIEWPGRKSLDQIPINGVEKVLAP